MLTGNQIWNRGIIKNGVSFKVDDKHIPSYGLDGMLYTFRVTVPWDMLTISPLMFVSFKTWEMVHMPANCGGLLTIKSTYGRQGIVLTTNSPVDPGYSGTLTVALFNAGIDPVTLYGQGGFIQMTVHEMSETPHQQYEGRHQNG